MRSVLRGILTLFTVSGGLAGLGPSALAQGPNSSGSLGGYGTASNYANPGMGGSSAMIIPYGGMFEGFMPSRMGGGSSLAFRSTPTATMGFNRTSFSLSPSPGGMGQGLGVKARMSAPFAAPGGMGLGSGMGQRNRSVGGMGVMPRSIGYPFRQPPSLVPSSSPGAGMSM